MIIKLSKTIAKVLANGDFIGEDELDLYEFGIFFSLSYIYFFITMLLSGILLNHIKESIIFYFSFISIRQFAGGYHSKSENICLATTLFSSLSGMLLISLFPIRLKQYITIFIVFISLIIVFLSPVDNPNNKLTNIEKQRFKKVTILVLFIQLLFTLSFLLLKLSDFALAILSSLSIELLLLIIGKIKYHTT